MDHHSADNRSSSTARNQGKKCEVLAAANSLDAILRQGLMIWMTDLCPNDYIDDLQGYNIYMFLKSSSYS